MPGEMEDFSTFHVLGDLCRANFRLHEDFAKSELAGNAIGLRFGIVERCAACGYGVSRNENGAVFGNFLRPRGDGEVVEPGRERDGKAIAEINVLLVEKCLK